jgi:hypothetical protein
MPWTLQMHCQSLIPRPVKQPTMSGFVPCEQGWSLTDWLRYSNIRKLFEILPRISIVGNDWLVPH